jgi:hypothetical protein
MPKVCTKDLLQDERTNTEFRDRLRNV